MNVFISWAGADREVKNVIASRLRDEKIKYFDSDEFCETDFSEECINNIRRSSVFIVIVSDASMDPRSYVFNEVVEAHRLEGEGLLNILVYKVTDSPYTARFAFNLNHISDANHIARVRKTEGVSGIDTLVKRVRSLLKRRAEGNPEKPCDVNVPKIVGTPLLSNKYFVDGSREEVLEKIEAAFSESNVIILSEIFGFGKKSVIKKYVQQHPEISAIEIQGMNDSVSKFFLVDLQFSNVNELVFENIDDKKAILKKFEFLEKLDENNMLVISNIHMDDELDDVIHSLLKNLKCKVVFITQDSADSYADAFPVITVGKMENAHLFELFYHYYKCINEQEKELLFPHLEKFFDDIGGHTKTIELTASVLYRELRATPEQVIARLSAGSEDNASLKTKIFDALSGLLTLENFTEDEIITLLFISLMANPVIDEADLHSLMDGAMDRGILASLDEHRWITYDVRFRTIYIEPIIAQIFVRKFAKDYEDVLILCLEYFKNVFYAKEYSLSSARDQAHLMSSVENFFELLNLNKLSAVVRESRNYMVFETKDIGKARTVSQEFLSQYRDKLSLNGEAQDEDCENEFSDELEEDECFEISAARWVNSFFMLILKASEVAPTLYNVANIGGNNLDEIRKLLIDEEISAEIAAEIGDEIFSKIIANLDGESDFDDVSYLVILLCGSIQQAFYRKDFDTLQKKSEELWDFLQDNPYVLNDDETCTIIVQLVRMISVLYLSSDLHQMGAAFHERILLIEWPDDIKYRLYLQYCDMLFSISNEDEYVLDVLQLAEDIFEDAMEKQNLSSSDYASAKLELSIYYARAFINVGEIDAAIEKFNEANNCDAISVYATSIISLISSITDKLMAIDIDRAIEFISENQDYISQYMERDDIDDSTAEKLDDLLLVYDMYQNNLADSFSQGGAVIDESYYQKYSKEKKNNTILMMSYNRIADKAKKYDLSAYTDEELVEYSRKLSDRVNNGDKKNNIIPEAFALVSEAGFRVLGYRHHQVQYVGAAAMVDGKIAEILNGEGKTYTIPLVAYVNSLYSSKTVVIDSSKYLTKRNYDWMKGIYELLGISVGYMPSSADREMMAESSEEKIIYTDIETFALSILYNEQSKTEKLLDLSSFSVVIDEADTTLIENAKERFWISSGVKNTSDYAQKCVTAYNVAAKIKGDETYYSLNRHKYPLLTREIRSVIESEFKVDYDDLSQANEIKMLEDLVEQALYYSSYVQGKNFNVKNGDICFEEQTTGQLRVLNYQSAFFVAASHGMPYKKYLSSLCKKVGVWNAIYVYSIFSKVGKLCGTSATVCSFKKEFKDIYDLEVVAIPTVLPIKRIDSTVGLYVKREYKNDAILELISEKTQIGQPILLVTENIEESVEFSNMLTSCGIVHTMLNGLNAEKSPEVFANAGTFGSVVVTTQIANRGVDIKLGGDARRMTIVDLVEKGVDISRIDDILYRIPTEEIKASKLYFEYAAAFEKNKAIVNLNKQKVVEAGGLCVISTTTYSDMRLEQQVRGRAGRQGDVGESYVFMSMEDGVFEGMLSSPLYLRMVQGMEIVDSSMLKRSIENFKRTVHHKTFEKIKDAADKCRCIDRSKAEIFKLKYGILNGTLAYDELVKLWCESEDNINSIRAIAEGDFDAANRTVLLLWKCYPEKFVNLNVKNLKETLFEITRLYVSESRWDEETKKNLFVTETVSMLSQHLTEMRDEEDAYRVIDIKNSNKFFADMYSKNLSKHIVETIGRWLVKLHQYDL